MVILLHKVVTLDDAVVVDVNHSALYVREQAGQVVPSVVQLSMYTCITFKCVPVCVPVCVCVCVRARARAF